MSTLFYVPSNKQPHLTVTSSSTLASTSTLTDVLDGNHNTYISFSNNTGKKNLDFDFASKTLDGLSSVAVFLNNYDTNYGTGYIGASGSNNGTTWGKLTPHNSPLTHSGTPNFVVDFSGSAKFRYYRLSFNGLPSTHQIGEVYWLKKLTLPRNHEVDNSNQQPVYFNTLTQLDGGYQYVNYNYANPVQKFTRSYKLITLSEIQTVEDIYDACRGTRYPFLYNSGSTIATAHFCRFQDNTPDWSGHAERSYKECTLNFNSIPFISSGESI